MNLIPGFGWLRSVATRRVPANPTSDPGDMGTAFGLDASIESVAELRPAPVPKSEARTPWSQRLVRRPQR
ncbi:MAG: hypothetical protein IV105_00065 [Rhizobacter sp.]|nr:hypothetical protein [Rhizobacter sp.]